MTGPAYDALEQRETLRREQRRAKGIKVLGRKAVLVQHHEDAPKTQREKLFGKNPGIGAADKWKRIEVIQRLESFLAEYRECPKAWAEGNRSVVFPVGTYLLDDADVGAALEHEGGHGVTKDMACAGLVGSRYIAAIVIAPASTMSGARTHAQTQRSGTSRTPLTSEMGTRSTLDPERVK